MTNRILNWNNRIIDYNYVAPLPFSPLDYNPIAWYDSSDVSTITKDISDRVSQWNDKSVLGYHLVQSVDLNKPLYGGSNGIVFGGNDFMNNNFGIIYNQQITMFIVWETLNINKFQVILNQYNSGVEGYNIFWNNSTGYQYIYNDYGIGAHNLNYYMGLAPTKVINTYIANNIGTSAIYENNVIKTTTSTLYDRGLGGIFIGSFENATYGFEGYIKEIIIYNSVLTTEQITTVNNYLNSKYNIY